MGHHVSTEPSYGTGQKSLGIYLVGLIICVILTLVSFGIVMMNGYTKTQMFTVIYVSAFIQFIAQLVCFLRLNTETPEGKMNVMTLAFTGIVLFTIVVGSLWIMANLQSNMM